MKKIILLSLLSLLFSTLSGQPCAHEGIGFYTQEDVNSFRKNYPGCRAIQGDVIISGSDITQLDSLMGLTYIQGYLEILHTDYLFSFYGLDSLRSVGGHLDIYSNASLRNLTGLDKLDSVRGNLEIYDNATMDSLKGLDHMSFLGGNLWICKNPVLRSISELSNLKRMDGGAIQINDNHILKNLSGLENINAGTIGGLYLYNNDSLYACNVSSTCYYINYSYAVTDIRSNAKGCSSRQEVKQACDTLGVTERESPETLKIFPNPASGPLSIEVILKASPASMSLFSSRGTEVFSRMITASPFRMDVSGLPPGCYFVRLVMSDGVLTRKLIID